MDKRREIAPRLASKMQPRAGAGLTRGVGGGGRRPENGRAGAEDAPQHGPAALFVADCQDLAAKPTRPGTDSQRRGGVQTQFVGLPDGAQQLPSGFCRGEIKPMKSPPPAASNAKLDLEDFNAFRHRRPKSGARKRGALMYLPQPSQLGFAFRKHLAGGNTFPPPTASREGERTWRWAEG